MARMGEVNQDSFWQAEGADSLLPSAAPQTKPIIAVEGLSWWLGCGPDHLRPCAVKELGRALCCCSLLEP
eukprot:9269217-Pyramimonas_sp.AAC.1